MPRMSYPRFFSVAEAPESVLALVGDLLPRLLEGEHPNLVVLREQLRRATVTRVELTGVGFFVGFSVPDGLRRTEPKRLVGGNAEISLSGVEHGAGCVLFVEDGRLSLFEGYTFDEEWPADARVTAVEHVKALAPG